MERLFVTSMTSVKTKMIQEVKLLKNNMRNFYVIALGFVLIVLGGITNILSGMTFWYPLGVITVPFVMAWIDFIRSKVSPKKVAVEAENVQ